MANDSEKLLLVLEEDGSGVDANAIYVAKTGNDTTGDGSFGNPYLTIAKANTEANGDASVLRVRVGAGTYAETVTPPKDSLSYIASGTVIINPGAGSNAFTVSAKDNITIDGFEIDTCLIGVHILSASLNATVKNCVIHDCAGEAVYIINGSNDALIQDCVAYATTSRAFYATQSSLRPVFRRCYSHTPTTGYGFEVENASDDALFEDCWSSDGVHGFIFKTSDGGTARRCVAWDLSSIGLYCKAATNITLENCVSYNNTFGCDLDQDGASPPNSENITLRNNIFANNATQGLRTRNSSNTGLDSDYNDFNGNGSPARIEGTNYLTLATYQAGTSQDPNSLEVDPAFVSTVYGGFKLPDGSALLTAGDDGGAMGIQG